MKLKYRRLLETKSVEPGHVLEDIPIPKSATRQVKIDGEDLGKRLIFMCLVALGLLTGILIYGGLQGCMPPENDLCDGRCAPQEVRLRDYSAIPGEVWICQQTGQLCDEDCFVPGDDTRFCWVLTSDDCVVRELEWQEIYCPYLDEQCQGL
jgi:hypothetical protein